MKDVPRYYCFMISHPPETTVKVNSCQETNEIDYVNHFTYDLRVSLVKHLTDCA